MIMTPKIEVNRCMNHWDSAGEGVNEVKAASQVCLELLLLCYTPSHTHTLFCLFTSSWLMIKKCHQSNLLKGTSPDTLRGFGAMKLLREIFKKKSALKASKTSKVENNTERQLVFLLSLHCSSFNTFPHFLY